MGANGHSLDTPLVIKRHITTQPPRPHRGSERGLAQGSAPALLLAIVTAIEHQSPGDRVTLKIKAELMPPFIPGGRQGQLTHQHITLLKTIDAHSHLTSHDIAGVHIT